MAVTSGLSAGGWGAIPLSLPWPSTGTGAPLWGKKLLLRQARRWPDSAVARARHPRRTTAPLARGIVSVPQGRILPMSTADAVALPINPAVLRWAREATGYDVAEAAFVAETTSEQIDRWEAGAERPTLDALRKLAHAYGRPVAALLLPTPPKQPRPTDFRSGAEPQHPISPRTRRRILRAIHIQSLATELYARLELAPLLAVGSVDSRADPEEVAGGLREQLGISLEEQFSWREDGTAYRSWRRHLEDLHVLVLQLRIPIDELRAFSLAEGGLSTIVVSSSDTYRGRAFSLMHEAAHTLLGASGICLPGPGLVLSLDARSTVEQFCNEVAGAVVVPRSGLLQHPATARLQALTDPPPDRMLDPLVDAFQASRQTIWQRLYRTGVIDEDVHRAKWAQWAPRRPPADTTGWNVPIPQRVLAERGSYVNAVAEALDRGVLAYPEALKHLDVRARYLDAVLDAASRAG